MPPHSRILKEGRFILGIFRSERMRVLYRSRQNDRLRVMLALVPIDITPPHTPLPVVRRKSERTIPYSWRACKQLRPSKDSTRITLPGAFRLISENNTLPLLRCLQLMLSVLQYPVFPAGCSQRDAPDWMPGIKARICKTSEVFLPGYAFSRHSSKVTSKLRSRCPPTSSCT
ncbi:uncharacterized protein TNCV_3935391 [Trichonephila clavipes]|nr:uncharacterized protein TNCV_3935391 [Trichonephila clavipes]